MLRNTNSESRKPIVKLFPRLARAAIATKVRIDRIGPRDRPRQFRDATRISDDVEANVCALDCCE